jgi:hypothetical protein
MRPIGWILMLCTWAIILIVMAGCIIRLLMAGRLTDDSSTAPDEPESR